jgi:hypothetical protein
MLDNSRGNVLKMGDIMFSDVTRSSIQYKGKQVYAGVRDNYRQTKVKIDAQTQDRFSIYHPKHEVTWANYLNAMHQVQRVCNAAALTAFRFMGKKLLPRFFTQRRALATKPGAVSWVSAAMAAGIMNSVGVHLDDQDTFDAMWIVLGNFYIVFPEYKKYIHLHDGDLITFKSSKIYHAMNTVGASADGRPDLRAKERSCNISVFARKSHDSSIDKREKAAQDNGAQKSRYHESQLMKLAKNHYTANSIEQLQPHRGTGA